MRMPSPSVKMWVMDGDKVAFIGSINLVVQPDETLHIVLTPADAKQWREILETYEEPEEDILDILNAPVV